MPYDTTIPGNREKELACKRAYRKHNSRNLSAYAKRRDTLIRMTVLHRYGGCCEFCGETDADKLQIDHVHDDGYRDRKEHGGNISHRLAKVPFDPRFRVLCASCNVKKRSAGPDPRLWTSVSVLETMAKT